MLIEFVKTIRIMMEEDMRQKPKVQLETPPPFWQQVLRILGIDALVVLSGALVFQDADQISNLFFISSLILFIIAAIPIATEIGGTAKLAGRAVKENKVVSSQLKDRQAIYERNAQTTYVYGLSGLITFILSFVTAFLI